MTDYSRRRVNGESARLYAHIVGWGMAVPETVLTNQDMEAILDTTDEWITARTGIHERRIAGDRDTTATLGFRAAKEALEVTNILPAQIDLIVVATCTPDHMFPSTASLIQNWLGASRAGAFDISAACSGFVYALDLAAQAIRSGSIKIALVIGAETMSRVVDWSDRATSILFGDGAGAVILQASGQAGGVLSSVLRSDGGGYDLLSLPAPFNRASSVQELGKLSMIGSEVFKFATRVIGESVRQALELANLRLEDVSLIVPHQANDRIIEAAARSLGVDKHIFMSNVAIYGNTSAASIPIALCEAVQQKRLSEGDHIVFVGFGGGLAWASAVIKWGIPHPEEVTSTRIARGRRQAGYLAVRLRALMRHWLRSTREATNRVRPRYGRMARLRRKIDQIDFDS
jgi:3-oxoacyl-[acyl-carrier-protein] synthase-3